MPKPQCDYCSRAQLRQEIAEHEAELAAICAAMAELPVHIRQSDQKVGSLKHKLARVLQELEEMRKRKSERRAQFKEVQERILSISNEIYGSNAYISSKKVVDESDLSFRKLEELMGELQIHHMARLFQEKHARILPELEEMRKRKSETRAQFKEVQELILNMSNDIYGSKEYISSKKVVNKSELSLKELEEIQGELQTLYKAKYVNSLPEGRSKSRPPGFNGEYYTLWKMKMEAFIKAHSFRVWKIVEQGDIVPRNARGLPKAKSEYTDGDRKNLELNSRAVHMICCALSEKDFFRVCRHLDSAKEMWDALEGIAGVTQRFKLEVKCPP